VPLLLCTSFIVCFPFQISDRKPSSHPRRAQSSAGTDESGDEEILYPRIHSPAISNSSSPLSSPGAVHRPFGGASQRTSRDGFEIDQLPTSVLDDDQRLNDNQRMDRLLVALGFPPAQHDTPSEGLFGNDSENHSVAAYSEDNEQVKRRVRSRIDSGSANTSDIHARDARFFPSDDFILSLDEGLSPMSTTANVTLLKPSFSADLSALEGYSSAAGFDVTAIVPKTSFPGILESLNSLDLK